MGDDLTRRARLDGLRLVSAVLAVGFAGLIGSLWLRPATGRYQLVGTGTVVHRLDTATGRIELFEVHAQFPDRSRALYYVPQGFTAADPAGVEAFVLDTGHPDQAVPPAASVSAPPAPDRR